MSKTLDEYLFQNVNLKEHIVATYRVRAKDNDFLDAARKIAIGQSIGNPDIRTERDSPELLRENLAKITGVVKLNDNEAVVNIAYPLVNFNIEEDGITQLFCTLMGGQMDIDAIRGCRLSGIKFPEEYLKHFKGPEFGMKNIRERAGAINRPLLGGIVKPKTGINVAQLEELVGELLEGGVDFIKEDEILGDPKYCKFKERVPRVLELVAKYEEKEGREIFYAPCINGDNYLERAEFAAKNGAKMVHLNVWAGLPAYKRLRDLDMKNTGIFFQKSGDKVFTEKEHRFGIDWKVMCDLARMMGADMIHAGMWGGYLSDTKEELGRVMEALRGGDRYNQTVPSLSCGSHPGLVDTTVKNFGVELMMNAGGAIQGHPMGTKAGAIAMRQAFECNRRGADIYEFMKDKKELKAAIEKWGYSS